MLKNHFKIKHIISSLIVISIFFAAITLLGHILIPFIIALILTYILNPFVELLILKLKLKRSIVSFFVSFLTFIIFLAIPICIIPIFAMQIKMIITKLPNLLTLLNDTILPNINLKYGTNLAINLDTIKPLLLNNADKLYNSINLFSPLAKNSIIILEILLYIILIPFILFYSINGWDKIIQFFDNLIPKTYKKIIYNISTDIDKMLSSYLRGQTSVMLIMACYYAIGLQITGLSSGVIIGVITGLLVFIPYIGIMIGLFISISIGFAEFAEMSSLLWILLVFIIGHIIEGWLVTPFMIGNKIGLNPIMIIFALMSFGTIFGFIGVLLALPLASIAVVLLRYAQQYYLNSKYYNEEEEKEE